MPGGIGPIPAKLAKRLQCRDRQTGLGSDASHAQIFFNLGLGRVHYLPDDHFLYFVESKDLSIRPIIDSVYQGLGAKPRLEQLFLDNHQLIKGALRLTLDEREARTLLAALRLKGIVISIADKPFTVPPGSL